MADRAGLASYNNARMNAVTAPPSGKVTPSAADYMQYAAAAAAQQLVTLPGAAVTQNAMQAVALMQQQQQMQMQMQMQMQQAARPQRNSGEKRDFENAVSSDYAASAAAAAASAAGDLPKKKKKITYALPRQCMEEGHFYVVLGEDVDVSTERFKILSLLGEGTFGKVVECWDRKRKEYCAVKIVRNVPKYSRDAQVEIKFMERIRQHDPEDRVPLMKIQRYFQNDQQHVCIVMPKYGPCLLDHLQKNGPLNNRALARVMFQAAVALDWFHTELRLMHTDLKPENMLLESDAVEADPATGRRVPAGDCRIRICDLGGCCDERHSRSAIVSTRHYRSPEVILGLGWMFSTDMWSMGCIIYELFSGRLLFDTHDNLEHLHLMERCIGRLPPDFARNASAETQSLFLPTGALRPCSDRKHLDRIARAKPLRESVPDAELRDVITGLLHYDRKQRMTARQLSTCKFIARHYPESLDHPMHPRNRGPLPPSPLC